MWPELALDNKGAFSYRRMKLALGHLEVTSRPMREW